MPTRTKVVRGSTPPRTTKPSAAVAERVSPQEVHEDDRSESKESGQKQLDNSGHIEGPGGQEADIFSSRLFAVLWSLAMLALLRLAHTCGDQVFDLTIKEYVPVATPHDG
jgi:hypothetical protein